MEQKQMEDELKKLRNISIPSVREREIYNVIQTEIDHYRNSTQNKKRHNRLWSKYKIVPAILLTVFLAFILIKSSPFIQHQGSSSATQPKSVQKTPSASLKAFNYSSEQIVQIKKVAKAVGVKPVIATKGLSSDHLTIVKNGGKGMLILDYVNFWVTESNQPISTPNVTYHIQTLNLGNGRTGKYLTVSKPKSAHLYFSMNGEYFCISDLKTYLERDVAQGIAKSFKSLQ